MAEKKKHHFIAQTYQEGFGNEYGKVHVYLKDNPAQHWWAAPESVGFEKYYYSQPKPDGGRDNNRLEDFFSSIEANWPTIVSNIEQHKHLGSILDQILLFALMHRVRVPTIRDAAEKTLAESVRMTARLLNDLGELPPAPEGFTFDQLEKMLTISIDPHRSILAMSDLAKGMIQILHAIGYKIIENATKEDFITSDNPVIYFDPSVPPKLMQPYVINRERMDIEFMFPINSRYMLWGHSALKPNSGAYLPAYERLTDKRLVRRANVLAARFAHRMVFSSQAHHQPLVEKYGGTSPVMLATHLVTPTGRGVIARFVFGKREQKPKWNKEAGQDDGTSSAA